MEGPLCPPDDPHFRLIETLLWTPEAGFQRGARHLARLARSAARLQIAPVGVEAALARVTGAGPLRVRLTVDRAGAARVEAAPFAPLPCGSVWRVAISDTSLASDYPWLGVKTTQRALYDAARAGLPGGVDEVLFCNENGALCEGTITNLFVRGTDGLVTPPLSDGVLPGILREELLNSGAAREGSLRVEDLATGAVFVGNSLRGLIAVEMV